MKFSRKIIALLTSACLLFSMNSLTISAATDQNQGLAQSNGKNDCALTSNGGEIYAGDGAWDNSKNLLSSLNDGKELTAITPGGTDYWSDWVTDYYNNNSYPETATIGAEFAYEYTVDEVCLYFVHDGGGCFVPTNLTLQYWDEAAQEFKDVTNQSKASGFAEDATGLTPENITFDPVKTTKLQAVMTRSQDESPDDPKGRGLGLNAFEVYTSDEIVKNDCALTASGGKIYAGDGAWDNSKNPLSSLNDGKELVEVTINGTDYWCDWNEEFYANNSYPETATIGAEFAYEYTVDEVCLYFIHDGGGCWVPTNVTLQYWDESAKEFKDVTNQSKANGFTEDGKGLTPENITFDPVKTTKLQAVMTRSQDESPDDPKGRGLGLNAFEVYTTEKIKDVSDEENVVEAPPAASAVTGVANPTILLNETTADGTWKFLFESPAGVPLPTASNQDYDFTQWTDKEWHDVVVPSGLVMQGFDIKNNNEYFYQRQVAIPADYADNNVIIRFDGVYSNSRVWIDGKYVRTHKGGFTTWEADITEFVTPGETVTLTVGVADIDGTTKGTWNPNGANMSDPSGASYYANHNIGGITRDVTLEARSKDYVANAYIDTVFEDMDYTKSTLEIDTRIYKASEGDVQLRFDLLDNDGSVVKTHTETFSDSADGFVQGLTSTHQISMEVENPRLWDAEHPNLYTLKSTIVKDGKDVSTTTQRIGFREILYGGAKGTDVNKVYVNGMEIKLRGTCRHDLVWTTGRSTTKEEDWQEIRDYKEANINFIRTSHYPVSKHLLDACDELGIYVEEENASCWGPKNTLNEAEEYMEGLKEQVGRDINRPSILIWSLGNESSWAPMYRQGYDYIKELDPTRLVVFSYPTTIYDDTQMDVFSVHYDSWNSPNLGSADMPVLHDEYAPSAVHHYVDLQRDLNVRNFWGESIYKQWTNVFEADGALGGAIWAAQDEVFFIPDGTTKRPGAQGDYDGQTAGDGIWGVVHDAYDRLKPEAWLLKKGYSPVRLDEDAFRFNGERLGIPVKNWYNHTNFNELELDYSIDGGEVQTMKLSALAPHEAGEIVININNSNAETVNLKFYEIFNGERTRMVDEFNIDMVVTTYEFIPASEDAPTLAESDSEITVNGDEFSVVFDKETGLIKEGKFQDDVLLTGGPNFHATYIDFGKWNPAETDGIVAEIVDNMAVVTLNGTYDNGQGVKFTISISKNGIIKTDYELTTDPADNNPVGETYLREVGISYDIPADMESVSWVREPYHSAYPEGHIGRAEGTAVKERENYESDPDVYGEKPDWNWELDMRDFSQYCMDDPRDGIVTNDFKSLRENVWNYDVNYPDTENRISVESEAEVAARVEVTPNWTFVDDRDEAVQYTGTWTKVDNEHYPNDANHTPNYAYNATEMGSSDTSATCTYTFTGTGINLISARYYNLGYLSVSIDGGAEEIVRLGGNIGHAKKRVVYSINGLDDGEHTIVVKPHSGQIRIDGFGVMPKEKLDQSAQLIIDQQYYYPNLNWGSYSGIPAQIQLGTTGSATIRLTNQDNKIEKKGAAEYVDATDIIDVPDSMFVGMPLNLTGTVLPEEATSQSIAFSIKDAGTTGAVLKGTRLTATAPGVIIVTAKVQNLEGVFEKDFAVLARMNAAIGGEMELGESTETEDKGRHPYYMNDGVIGGGYWTDFNMDHYKNNDYVDPAEVIANLNGEQTVNGAEMYFIYDGGGCFPPKTVILQYWDEEQQEFVNVSNQSQTEDFTGNAGGTLPSVITFDPVSTTKLRAVMTHNNVDNLGRAIAITEFVVLADEPMEAVGLEVTKLPAKVEYFIGEEFDSTGLELKINYDNGYFRYLKASDCEITGFDSSNAGKKTITVSYTENGVEKTATFDVTVKEIVLESITLTGPTQTEYFVGEELKEAGLVVTAHYSDGTSKEVTGYQVSGFDSTKAGKNTVTVSYTEKGVAKTASFEVTIKEKPADAVLESITLKGPDKTEYKVGEGMDLKGLAVTAHYSNGTSREVTGYQVSGFDSTKAGKITVTVSYTEDGVTKTAAFDLTVKETGGSSSGDGSSTGDGTTGDGTQTGDMAPIMLVTAVMLLALGACLVLVLVRRAKIK